ncbi:MAG: phosphoenolpyruvate synthase [Haliscomenobacteraceae bacterium CHB4]|nr:phosphoenolpyruvate synthase [Haliscomenobacteraceae bacterium CHB4]
MPTFIKNFSEISINELALVGGKNASLGEMFSQLTPKGILVPDGFAVTADAYRLFLEENKLRKPLTDLLHKLDKTNFSNLNDIGAEARELIRKAAMPDAVGAAIKQACRDLRRREGADFSLAVRSSATAEDLPSASFAGQLESFLNIRGEDELVKTVHRCFASLFTNRAIKYREDQGFGNIDVALSVGVQKMVRSDLASSGVAFTLDPDTGFDRIVVIDSIYGLGENIVQGRSTPDEFALFKPHIGTHFNPVIQRKLGEKEWTMVYADPAKSSATVENRQTPSQKRDTFSLSDADVATLGKWCVQIEQHYGKAMDIEWAKDGPDGHLYIVQARPETVHSGKKGAHAVVRTYKIRSKGKKLTEGIALGEKIAFGKARLLRSPQEAHLLQEGEVLVTDITNPDWDPIMKRAAAIVTNKGGRTSHAAIVARELGTTAIVGCGNATDKIHDGEEITVSCAEGKTGFIYAGKAEWEVEEKDISNLQMPKTAPMLILGDPSLAFQQSFLPNRGVGLLRMEFLITHHIKVHPLALTRFEQITNPGIREGIAELTRHYRDKKDYFVDKLAQGVATIAAAFHPHDVIVRMSDFKSNEYANLIGGQQFEPLEENPMIGFRGASRYYSPLYKDGFALECKAMKKVREEMGFTNVKLMIPFCRTVEEGKQVVATMKEFGLERGQNGLEVYVMVEIPSNVLMAEQFAEVFDGFSIGSNDLTQLTLGLDRDSSLVSSLFNEKNPAVMRLIATAIRTARKKGIKIGLCGQAPSDMPEFAQFLVNEGINSISFNADALLKGIGNMTAAEAGGKGISFTEASTGENDPMTPNDLMTPNDPMTLITRDNTYVKPAPITNWEWEREEDGGEFLK